MDIPSSLAIIALTGLIHASFQLSISMLTLLSGHALGSKTSHQRLQSLIGGFLFGTAFMTLLLLSTVSMWLQAIFSDGIATIAWSVVAGLTIGLGIAVWVFYYRRQPGTSLWIPRTLAHFLTDKTKRTKHTAESFALGMTSVVMEIVFIAGPLIMAGLIILQLPPTWQLFGIIEYVFISLLPLMIVGAKVSGGKKIDKIQRWREANKNFLQFIAGAGLIVLGFYIYANEVVVSLVSSTGGF